MATVNWLMAIAGLLGLQINEAHFQTGFRNTHFEH